MPEFGMLFDWKDYKKNKTMIRDNKTYREFCKMFTNCIVIARSQWREWAYSQNFADYGTASDKAYMIWAYMNYSEWWLKKHRQA